MLHAILAALSRSETRGCRTNDGDARPPRCAYSARIAPGLGRLRGAGRHVDARQSGRRRLSSRLRPDRGRRPRDPGPRRVDRRSGSLAPAGPVRRTVPARDDRRRHPGAAALSRRARRHGDALHGRRRPRGGAEFPRLGGHRPQGGVAALDADPLDDQDHATLCGLCGRDGRRARQSARGAGALPLSRQQDTYFRLHGTNEPETIGTAVSSGCIRLFNHDIIDLYNRVPVGTPVVVLQEPGPVAELQAPEPAEAAGAQPARRWARRSRTVHTAPAPMDTIRALMAAAPTPGPITTPGRRGRGQDRPGRTAGSISRKRELLRGAAVAEQAPAAAGRRRPRGFHLLWAAAPVGSARRFRRRASP